MLMMMIMVTLSEKGGGASWSINNWRNSKDGQLLLLGPTHFRISSFSADEDDH